MFITHASATKPISKEVFITVTATNVTNNNAIYDSTNVSYTKAINYLFVCMCVGQPFMQLPDGIHKSMSFLTSLSFIGK